MLEGKRGMEGKPNEGKRDRFFSIINKGIFQKKRGKMGEGKFGR